jgi:hypothetical protein
MTNIIDLDVVTQLDIDPDKVLNAALGKLDQVVIIGCNQDDDIYFASSTGDIGQVLLLMECAKKELMSDD